MMGFSLRDGMPRLLFVLAVVLAGLWGIQLYPQAGALFMPINLLTAQLGAGILTRAGLPVMQEATHITHASGFSCEIDYTCTAVIPVLLLSAAILAWRASWRRRLAGVLQGVLLLLAVNLLRIVTLVWLGVRFPLWLDIAHLWLWPALLIVVIAGYWYIWIRVSSD